MAIRVPEPPRKNGGLDPLSKAVIAFAAAFFVVLGPVVFAHILGYDIGAGGLFLFAVPFFIAFAVYYGSKPPNSED